MYVCASRVCMRIRMASRLVLLALSASLVIIAALFSRLSSYDGPPYTNYDASLYFSHAHLRVPTSKNEVISIVKSAVEKSQKVRVVGSGHSWSGLAVSEDILISLYNYTGIVLLNREEMQVTVKAGTTLKQLNGYLDDQGLAMKNLGSISEQTVAGAISTGTHGNGIEFGNLATLVTRLEFVNGKGELITVSAKDEPSDVFKAAQVSLGMLGVITEVTFAITKKYFLREVLSRHSFEECISNFDPLMRSGDHVKMWFELFSGTCGLFAINGTTETQPRDNPNWTSKNFEILALEMILLVTSWFPFSVPHVMKLIFLPSSVFSPHDRVDTSFKILEVPHILPTHWEAELVVPFEGCAVAIQELRQFVVESHLPVNMPIEVRPVKSDDIWMSPDYGRTSCHITLALYNPSAEKTQIYFDQSFDITSKTLKLSPRVHWGKFVTGLSNNDVLKSMYPRFSDFTMIRSEMDPQSLFVNHALRETFKF